MTISPPILAIFGTRNKEDYVSILFNQLATHGEVDRDYTYG